MSDLRKADRSTFSDKDDYEVGYGRPPRERQFKKGEPRRNPRGRPRKERRKQINLYEVITEEISITRNGKTKKVPFPIAHIHQIKERAVKGDPKASQLLVQIYKSFGFFGNSTPDSNDEPFEFTLKIGDRILTAPYDEFDQALESSNGDKANSDIKKDSNGEPR